MVASDLASFPILQDPYITPDAAHSYKSSVLSFLSWPFLGAWGENPEKPRCIIFL